MKFRHSLRWTPSTDLVSLSEVGFPPTYADDAILATHSQSALQNNDVFGAAGVAGDIPNAYCVVAAQGPGSPLGLDKVFAYATVIDNQSQDPYFVFGRPVLRKNTRPGAGRRRSMAQGPPENRRFPRVRRRSDLAMDRGFPPTQSASRP